MKFTTWCKSFFVERPIGNTWYERICIAIDEGWDFTEGDKILALSMPTCALGERASAIKGSNPHQPEDAFKDRGKAFQLALEFYSDVMNSSGKKVWDTWNQIQQLEVKEPESPTNGHVDGTDKAI
jgi:hypothetical protein